MSFNEIEHSRTARPMVRHSEADLPITAERKIQRCGRPSDGLVRQLLGEQGAKEFRRDLWQQRAVVLACNASSTLGASWLTAADIDNLLSSVDFPATNLDLANGSEPLPKTSYAPGGIIERGKVLGLHREGATIILRAAHRWSAKLRQLCAGLEWDFGFPAQANIYLTPAGRKSTPPHWDTHDLFIVQVAGMKKWKLFSSDYVLPLDSQRFSEETFLLGPLVNELNLSAGEVLYLPRGTIHEPVADTYSIHVSLGVLVSRWTDLLVDLVETVGENRPELRSIVDLPEGELNEFHQREIVDRLMQVADLLRDRSGCERAVRRHMNALLSQHGDNRERALLEIMRETKLSKSSLLRRTPSAYTWIEPKAERLQVYWKRGQFSVPSLHAFFIEVVLKGSPFKIEDFPGCGTEEERLAFCGALIEEGLLEILTPCNCEEVENHALRKVRTVDRNYILKAEEETAMLSYRREQTPEEIQYRSKRLDLALEAGSIFVGEQAGQVAGYYWVERKANETWFLVDFYVDKVFRHQRVADWLLECAISTSVNAGARKLQLVISDYNAPAKHFFARHGAIALEVNAAEGLREYELPLEGAM